MLTARVARSWRIVRLRRIERNVGTQSMHWTRWMHAFGAMKALCELYALGVLNNLAALSAFGALYARHRRTVCMSDARRMH